MGRFNTYSVSLIGNVADIREFEYQLDNDFFKKIDGNEVQKGKITVKLTVKRSLSTFEFLFTIDGVVQVPCDRCLDDMDVEISTNEKLFVKLGKEYAEESDNVIVVPETEGEINIAWFLYEFVALCVPMKHVHGPGKCNKAMTTKLRKHSAKSEDDDDNIGFDEADESVEDVVETDPRWDELKKIVDNN